MDKLDFSDLDHELDGLPSIDELLARIYTDTTPAVLTPAPTANQTLFSEKISIRIPYHLLTALKAQAGQIGIGYQTLINQILGVHVYG